MKRTKIGTTIETTMGRTEPVCRTAFRQSRPRGCGVFCFAHDRRSGVFAPPRRGKGEVEPRMRANRRECVESSRITLAWASHPCPCLKSVVFLPGSFTVKHVKTVKSREMRTTDYGYHGSTTANEGDLRRSRQVGRWVAPPGPSPPRLIGRTGTSPGGDAIFVSASAERGTSGWDSSSTREMLCSEGASPGCCCGCRACSCCDSPSDSSWRCCSSCRPG
jgi:hypothetical protein